MRKLITLVGPGFLGLLLAAAATAATDLSKLNTADELWGHLVKLQQGPPIPPQTPEEARTIFGAHLRAVDAAASKFIAKYPDDERRWEVQIVLAQARAMLAGVEGREPDLAELKKLLLEITRGKGVPPMIDLEARWYLVEICAEENSAESRKYLEQATKHPDPRLAELAERRLALVKLKQNPLELKFTSLKGDPVDLTKLRGKVVLIDFWASWCGPCRMDMPNVLKAYRQYRDQGFEIIGISLDDDKDQLLAYLNDQGISWPQYFDGKGFESPLSRRFAVEKVPTQWLIDKKGYLRDARAEGNLEQAIPKLLAE